MIARNNGHANGRTTWPPDIAEPGPNQEEVILSSSDRRELLEYLSQIDPKLAKMAELMLGHDLWETRELGEALENTLGEVANLRRRLYRAVRAFLTGKRS